MKVRIRSVLSPPLLSPAGLLVRAAWIALAFIAVHLAGLREHTSIICGTLQSGNPADAKSAVLGTVYAVLYFLAVLLAPILAIAATIFAGLAGLGSSAKEGDRS